MSMYEKFEDRLADAVNQEPIVYADCTQSELLFAISTGGIVGLSMGVVIGLSIGIFMLGILIGLLIGVGVAWVTMQALKHIRQKYYLTWLKEKLFVTKQLFLGGYQFVSETKRYSKGGRRG